MRALLAGVHGHGQWHLRNLAARDGVTLAGICDPRPPTAEIAELAGNVPYGPDLGTMLEAVRPDITILVTPIDTHVDLALTALAAGSHLLLEKPPAATFDGYTRLVDAVARSGRACQVGFQSLGSAAVPAVRRLIAEGRIGTVTGVGAGGAWIREAGYYARARWAGRRRLDGSPVVDGVLTNPLAHAVATALAVAGADRPGAVREVRPELFHAHDIEADDTSSVRITAAGAPPITVAATLCAAEHTVPYVIVHGDRGRITLYYTRDEVVLATPERTEKTLHPRTDLVTNLATHIRDPWNPLLVPLPVVEGFMRVLDAIRTAPDPRPLPPDAVTAIGAGAHRRYVVRGIDAAVTASANRVRTFSELGVPWASAVSNERHSRSIESSESAVRSVGDA